MKQEVSTLIKNAAAAAHFSLLKRTINQAMTCALCKADRKEEKKTTAMKSHSSHLLRKRSHFGTGYYKTPSSTFFLY